MNVKINSRQCISEHKYFKARKDNYSLPSGKNVDEYFVVEMPSSACATAITENGEVILVKQYRHPIETESIEIPGGFVDDDEAPEKAIARELMEETGYRFSTIVYLGKTFSNPGVLNNRTYLFVATGGVKIAQQQLDENEEINIELHSITDVKQLLEDNKIHQSMHELCLRKAFDYLEAATLQ
jgi:ADP-ribose pyrophosphatase